MIFWNLFPALQIECLPHDTLVSAHRPSWCRKGLARGRCLAGVTCPSSSNLSWTYIYSLWPESYLNSGEAQEFSCSPLQTTLASGWNLLVGLTTHTTQHHYQTVSQKLSVLVLQAHIITPTSTSFCCCKQRKPRQRHSQSHLHLWRCPVDLEPKESDLSDPLSPVSWVTRGSQTEATRQKHQDEGSKLLSPENSAQLKENTSKLVKAEMSLVCPGISTLSLFAPVQIPSPLSLHHDGDANH